VGRTADPAPPVDLKGFDFVDFGCSAGGSIVWAARKFGGRRGLGVDINPGKVRFATMIDFLEHLPTLVGPSRAYEKGAAGRTRGASFPSRVAAQC
jgi:hypothetical protein